MNNMMRCRGETYFARVPKGRNVDNPGCNPGGRWREGKPVRRTGGEKGEDDVPRGKQSSSKQYLNL